MPATKRQSKRRIEDIEEGQFHHLSHKRRTRSRAQSQEQVEKRKETNFTVMTDFDLETQPPSQGSCSIFNNNNNDNINNDDNSNNNNLHLNDENPINMDSTTRQSVPPNNQLNASDCIQEITETEEEANSLNILELDPLSFDNVVFCVGTTKHKVTDEDDKPCKRIDEKIAGGIVKDKEFKDEIKDNIDEKPNRVSGENSRSLLDNNISVVTSTSIGEDASRNNQSLPIQCENIVNKDRHSLLKCETRICSQEPRQVFQPLFKNTQKAKGSEVGKNSDIKGNILNLDRDLNIHDVTSSLCNVSHESVARSEKGNDDCMFSKKETSVVSGSRNEYKNDKERVNNDKVRYADILPPTDNLESLRDDTDINMKKVMESQDPELRKNMEGNDKMIMRYLFRRLKEGREEQKLENTIVSRRNDSQNISEITVNEDILSNGNEKKLPPKSSKETESITDTVTCVGKDVETYEKDEMIYDNMNILNRKVCVMSKTIPSGVLDGNTSLNGAHPIPFSESDKMDNGESNHDSKLDNGVISETVYVGNHATIHSNPLISNLNKTTNKELTPSTNLDLSERENSNFGCTQGFSISSQHNEDKTKNLLQSNSQTTVKTLVLSQESTCKTLPLQEGEDDAKFFTQGFNVLLSTDGSATTTTDGIPADIFNNVSCSNKVSNSHLVNTSHDAHAVLSETNNKLSSTEILNEKNVNSIKEDITLIANNHQRVEKVGCENFLKTDSVLIHSQQEKMKNRGKHLKEKPVEEKINQPSGLVEIDYKENIMLNSYNKNMKCGEIENKTTKIDQVIPHDDENCVNSSKQDMGCEMKANKLNDDEFRSSDDLLIKVTNDCFDEKRVREVELDKGLVGNNTEQAIKNDIANEKCLDKMNLISVDNERDSDTTVTKGSRFCSSKSNYTSKENNTIPPQMDLREIYQTTNIMATEKRINMNEMVEDKLFDIFHPPQDIDTLMESLDNTAESNLDKDVKLFHTFLPNDFTNKNKSQMESTTSNDNDNDDNKDNDSNVNWNKIKSYTNTCTKFNSDNMKKNASIQQCTFEYDDRTNKENDNKCTTSSRSSVFSNTNTFLGCKSSSSKSDNAGQSHAVVGNPTFSNASNNSKQNCPDVEKQISSQLSVFKQSCPVDDGMDLIMMMMTDSQMYPELSTNKNETEMEVEYENKQKAAKHHVDGKREEGRHLVKLVLNELVSVNRQLLRLKKDMDVTKRKLSANAAAMTATMSTTTTQQKSCPRQQPGNNQQQQQVSTMFKKMSKNNFKP